MAETLTTSSVLRRKRNKNKRKPKKHDQQVPDEGVAEVEDEGEGEGEYEIEDEVEDESEGEVLKAFGAVNVFAHFGNTPQSYLYNSPYECVPELARYPKFQRLDRETPSLTHEFEGNIEDYFYKNDFSNHVYLLNPDRVAILRTAMDMVYTRLNILFCVDVEAWELNNSLVTEIGIAIYDPRGQELAMLPHITQIHIAIKEHYDKNNGRYVSEHKRNFNGDMTFVMPQREAVELTQHLIEYYFKPRDTFGCCLVGHDVKGDITWLKNLGIQFPNEISVLDTQAVYRASHGKTGCSLKNALKMFHLPHAFLHNAGNDAYYTLLLALSLCDPHARESNQVDRFRPELLYTEVENAKPGRRKKIDKANESHLVEVESVKHLLENLFFEDSLR